MILLRACNYWVKLTKASSVRQNTCRILVLMLKETSLRTNLPWSCTANSSPSLKRWSFLAEGSLTTKVRAYLSDTISMALMKAIPMPSQSSLTKSRSHTRSLHTLNLLTSQSQRKILTVRSMPLSTLLLRASMMTLMLRLLTVSS